MVEIADISDAEHLEAWLEDQPREVPAWIAFRAAARVLPVWLQAVQTETWARDNNLTALPILRCLLISSVAAKRPSAEIVQAAESAATSASDIPNHENIAVHTAPRAAQVATASVALMGPRQAAIAVATAAVRRDDRMWSTVREDAASLQDGNLPDDALPLWPNSTSPYEDEWDFTKTGVAQHDTEGNWRFWLDWYDAQLAGRTMLPDPARTWDMLEKIALIDPETWDAGPEVVNPRIREIWELYRLRVEVAALQAEKEAFLASRASQAQRSHNQPPEGLVDDQPELARQITIVWDSLDETREELEQDTPDKGKLREIAERLLSALTAVAKYCAKVADTAVISAAKVGGGAVGTAVLDHVANNGRLMQFARDLLTYGSG